MDTKYLEHCIRADLRLLWRAKTTKAAKYVQGRLDAFLYILTCKDTDDTHKRFIRNVQGSINLALECP